MSNKNLFYAVLLSIGFILLWERFVVRKFAPPAPPPAVAPATAPEPALTPPEKKARKAKTPEALPTPASVARIQIKTDGVEVTLENRGARVTSWRYYEDDHWVELVDPSPGGGGYPLELYPDVNYALASHTAREAVFQADLPNGLRVQKTLSLAPPAGEENQPFHRVSLAFTNTGAEPVEIKNGLSWGEGLQKINGGGEKSPDTAAEMRAVGYTGQIRSWRTGMFTRTIDAVHSGPFQWIGIDNHHFLAAFIATEQPFPSARVIASKKTAPTVEIPFNTSVKPGETVREEALLYVGPKKYGYLKEIGQNLDKSVDFGFFGIISKGLLVTLEFFERLTGNYGWAIILLTISIQILVFPLTKKSLQHSLRMRELQPQIKTLQTKFKGDPKRMQVEMLNLYKKNGMKLMGMEGCFPILLQIPIFFAFYSTLRVAYELRGAPWIFWIQDLAAPDPFYVLPILMGAGMLLQQKLTTVSVDPAQAKMMLIMPIVFTFMFLKLPAGLVLYWTVNSITTILVQKLLNLKKPAVSTSG